MLNQYKKYKNNRKIILTALLIVAVATCVLLFFVVRKNKVSTVEVIEVVDFQTEMLLFDKIIKYAWLSIETGDLEEANINTNDAYIKWEAIDRDYKENKPAAYSKTKDWQSFLFSVGKHLKKSNELVQENNLSGAISELREAIKILDEARLVNGLESHSKELLDYYDLVKRASEAGNREAVQPYLPELKIAFTFLKEINFGDELSQIIIDMEKEIAVLDKSLYGPDFKNAQARLKQLFFDLYLKY